MSALARQAGYMGDRARGAQFGRPDQPPEGPGPHAFRVARIEIDQDGYDEGGAYWGIGLPLFRFVEDDADPARPPAEGFVRARTRAEAVREVRRTYPAARVA